MPNFPTGMSGIWLSNGRNFLACRWWKPIAARAPNSPSSARSWSGPDSGPQARLGPQLENLAQELATEIKPFLRTGPAVIRVHASHGFAVPKLRELLDQTPGIAIDLRYVSNQNSLASLAQGACDLSGVHLPRGELRRQNIEASKKWLDAARTSHHQLRNPRDGIDRQARQSAWHRTRSSDIAEKQARFVNRDHDSGTRLLFDQLLELNKVDETKINGLEQIEFTHAAVAAYVASDMADVSFGVEAAARQFGLDFIRLLTEDYIFVCRRSFLETEPMQRLLDVVKGPAFREAVASLPGYRAVKIGEVSTVKEFLDSVETVPVASRKRRN